MKKYYYCQDKKYSTVLHATKPDTEYKYCTVFVFSIPGTMIIFFTTNKQQKERINSV